MACIAPGPKLADVRGKARRYFSAGDRPERASNLGDTPGAEARAATVDYVACYAARRRDGRPQGGGRGPWPRRFRGTDRIHAVSITFEPKALEQSVGARPMNRCAKSVASTTRPRIASLRHRPRQVRRTLGLDARANGGGATRASSPACLEWFAAHPRKMNKQHADRHPRQPAAPLPGRFLYEPLKADYRCHGPMPGGERQAGVGLRTWGASIRGLVQGGGTVTPTHAARMAAAEASRIISVFGVGYDRRPPTDYLP